MNLKQMKLKTIYMNAENMFNSFHVHVRYDVCVCAPVYVYIAM